MKTDFEKTALKDIHSNWNLQMQIDKVQLNKNTKILDLDIIIFCLVYPKLY